jgi:DNA-binding GntR family transcriptional regulator
MQASIAEHKEIVKALSQGDPKRCEELMSHHVDIAYQRLNSADAQEKTKAK